MLRVINDRIVDAQGHPVRLRGVCIGGWMNLENFINGYPGSEHGLRAAMTATLGPAKARFFFERLLDAFLTEADVTFIKSTGANVMRLPLNYRHFESDMRPFQYFEQGFARLQQAVDWCTKHGLYVILDLHAAPGWQNPDWHSDNDLGRTLFWQHPHFQDRWIALWEELARRYRGNPTIAGYDVLNEPLSTWQDPSSDCATIESVYRRAVSAIRAVDPDHIIFLEGDSFGSRFEDLAAPCTSNLVYSGHDYNPAVVGPGPYPGVIDGVYWHHERLHLSLSRHQGITFARQHSVPLWIGEFGTVFTGPAHEIPDRLRALDDQAEIYESLGLHWTMWTYKDVGTMGWVSLDPASPYMQLIAPLLAAKRTLDADAWSPGLTPGPARHLISDLSRLIEGALPGLEIDPAENEHRLARVLLHGHSANLMQALYVNLFRGMSEEQIDDVLQSFAFLRCRPNNALIQIVRQHCRQAVYSIAA